MTLISWWVSAFKGLGCFNIECFLSKIPRLKLGLEEGDIVFQGCVARGPQRRYLGPSGLLDPISDQFRLTPDFSDSPIFIQIFFRPRELQGSIFTRSNFRSDANLNIDLEAIFLKKENPCLAEYMKHRVTTRCVFGYPACMQ